MFVVLTSVKRRYEKRRTEHRKLSCLSGGPLPFGSIWVFNLSIAYRDKKVVGVIVRFSCAASTDDIRYGHYFIQPKILTNELAVKFS
jgi:hypothetical protein